MRGGVVDSSPRATSVLTNDDAAVIVPNPPLVSRQVVGGSHLPPDARFRVGVSYAANQEEVRDVLLQLGEGQAGVPEHPEPSVLSRGRADSATVFELRVWTRDDAERPGALQGGLPFEIGKAFRERNIALPFPRRDVPLTRSPPGET